MTRNVSKIEVEKAVKKMKARGSAGPDKIPVEAWRVLGKEGIDLLRDLFQ